MALFAKFLNISSILKQHVVCFGEAVKVFSRHALPTRKGSTCHRGNVG